MHQLTDLIHLLLCHTPHTYDMMEFKKKDSNFCQYYLENDIAGGENLTDHLLWKDVVVKFKTSLSLRSDEEAMNFVRDCIKIAQEINKLSKGSKPKLDFIYTIIG